jgi:hypothetical protein
MSRGREILPADRGDTSAERPRNSSSGGRELERRGGRGILPAGRRGLGKRSGREILPAGGGSPRGGAAAQFFLPAGDW